MLFWGLKKLRKETKEEKRKHLKQVELMIDIIRKIQSLECYQVLAHSAPRRTGQ